MMGQQFYCMPMPMPMMMPYMDDESEEKCYMEMCSDNYKMMMQYVNRELDKMDEKEYMKMTQCPDRSMIERMTDNICDCVMKDMPTMGEAIETQGTISVQRFGRRPFVRDFATVLLLRELFRRRRRTPFYRQRYFGPGYGPGYGYGPWY